MSEKPRDQALFDKACKDWNPYDYHGSLVSLFNKAWDQGAIAGMLANLNTNTWRPFNESFWELKLTPAECVFIFADGKTQVGDWRRPVAVLMEPAENLSVHDRHGRWDIQFEEAIAWTRKPKKT